MTESVCGPLTENEIINAEDDALPLLEVTLYGDALELEKLGRRLKCGSRQLPARLKIHKISDLMKIVEAGIGKTPAMTLNGKILFEGYRQTEEIDEILRQCLLKESFEQASTDKTNP